MIFDGVLTEDLRQHACFVKMQFFFLSLNYDVVPRYIHLKSVFYLIYFLVGGAWVGNKWWAYSAFAASLANMAFFAYLALRAFFDSLANFANFAPPAIIAFSARPAFPAMRDFLA